MLKHPEQVSKHLAAEDGATVVEYGVLIALIIAACIATIFIFGNQIQGGFQMFSDRLADELVRPPTAGTP